MPGHLIFEARSCASDPLLRRKALIYSRFASDEQIYAHAVGEIRIDVSHFELMTTNLVQLSVKENVTDCGLLPVTEAGSSLTLEWTRLVG